jgi:choline dehydrogenase-like flavoprotein
MYRGETMAGVIADESRLDTDRGFVGGYYMETIALGPAFFGKFVAPGTWGPQLAEVVSDYLGTAGMWIVGEDMPQESNCITLSDGKDQHGLPVANVHFDDHPNDIAMRQHGLRQGAAVYRAVGAHRTIETPPYPSTHNLGSCRMSQRPGDGVVDRYGRSHDVPNLFISDGSQFTTGAAANPTMTIVALAIRQAEFIASDSELRGA